MLALHVSRSFCDRCRMPEDFCYPDPDTMKQETRAGDAAWPEAGRDRHSRAAVHVSQFF